MIKIAYVPNGIVIAGYFEESCFTKANSKLIEHLVTRYYLPSEKRVLFTRLVTIDRRENLTCTISI